CKNSTGDYKYTKSCAPCGKTPPKTLKKSLNSPTVIVRMVQSWPLILPVQNSDSPSAILLRSLPGSMTVLCPSRFTLAKPTAWTRLVAHSRLDEHCASATESI